MGERVVLGCHVYLNNPTIGLRDSTFLIATCGVAQQEACFVGAAQEC